jgi:hypothetical protein
VAEAAVIRAAAEAEPTIAVAGAAIPAGAQVIDLRVGQDTGPLEAPVTAAIGLEELQATAAIGRGPHTVAHGLLRAILDTVRDPAINQDRVDTPTPAVHPACITIPAERVLPVRPAGRRVARAILHRATLAWVEVALLPTQEAIT